MKKGLKRVLSAILICSLLITLVPSSASASSATGTKQYKSYNLTSYWNGTWSWPTLLKAKWTGKTGGKYSGTTTPSKITHSDILSATGIGSISFSTSGGSIAISGSTATVKYTTSGSKSITCRPTYIMSKGLTFTASMYTSTQYKFGSTYITVTSYD